MRQQAEDVGAALDSSVSRNRNAWEAGMTGRVTDNVRVFGRLGRSFRFANTDELFGFDPMTYATVFRGDLKPQQGTLREVGGGWHQDSFDLRASVFGLNLTDEIAYDGNAFTNVNLSPTRRQGLEVELQWQLGHDLTTRLALTSTNATFRGGVDDGKTIPLVPHNKATLGMTWRGGRAGTWSALANYLGSQRYSGDAANARDLMPAYTTVDLQAAWDFAPWTFTARIANLFDKRYASFAGYSTSYSDYFYYPADPRSIFLTVRHNFR
jgi:iron complex outermembrane receptor protein